EVDERGATDQPGEPGDGRVWRQDVAAEDDRSAQRRPKHETVALALEVARPQVLVQRLELSGGVAGASFAQRLLVDICGVDLDPVDEALLAQRLAQEDGRRIRLFAR